MEKRQVRCSCYLMITALIWGAAFVAQSKGGDAIGPYSFSCLRYFLAGLMMLPLRSLFNRWGITDCMPPTRKNQRNLWIGGILCGVFLCFVSIFQQLGLYMGTQSGKAGFLSSCYIVIVPILGLFLKKKCSWNVWLAVAVTMAGLYLLCIKGSLSLQMSDLLILFAALMSALHILTVDRFMNKVDVVRMVCIQFFTASALAAIPMACFDIGISLEGLQTWAEALFSQDAVWSLLYAGVLSGGIAYTLQNLGQQGVHPTIASLLLSLESVFAVLAGWLVLGESLNQREVLGCVLIFAAIVTAQVPVKKNC